jgi:hypothetical protein
MTRSNHRFQCRRLFSVPFLGGMSQSYDATPRIKRLLGGDSICREMKQMAF